MAKVWLVEGFSGDYEDKAWWVVSAWDLERSAKKEAERLNEISRQFRQAQDDDPMPRDDEDDKEGTQYERWRKRRAKRLVKFQKMAGDNRLDEYDPAHYRAYTVPFHARRSDDTGTQA